MIVSRLCLFIITFSIHLASIAQNSVHDSLINVIAKTTVDSTKAKLYNALSSQHVNTDPDTAIYYAKKALSIAQNSSYTIGELEALSVLGKAHLVVGEYSLSLTYLKDALKKTPNERPLPRKTIKIISDVNNNIGSNYLSQSNYDLGLLHYTIALKLRESINDSNGVVISYNNIGLIYYFKGNYKKALQNYLLSLKKAEQINDDKGMLLGYNNIGKVYNDQQEYDNAYVNFVKTLEKAEKLNIPTYKATAYFNIADILLTQKKYEEALANANKSYEISKQINNNSNLANSLDIMGQAYLSLNKYSLALEKEFEALKLCREADHKINMTGVLISISKIYLKQKNYEQAILFGTQALQLAKEIESPTSEQNISNTLAECYASTSNYEKAYEMKSQSLLLNDSVLSGKNQQEMLRQTISYDYEKQSLADSLKYDANKKLVAYENQTKLKTAQTKQILLVIVLAFAIVVGFVLFRRFKVSQQQKDIIEQQKTIVEEQKQSLEQKTKEIKDSILYSKEIQNTFLKSLVNDHKYFNDSLLIYKPKDVVSGDFYWHKEIDDCLYVVVGDCTGHGVPGAIITVLAIQSLEKTIVQIKHLERLHELNALLKEEFNVYYDKDNYVSIGLDYSIICINKKTNTLYLAGSGSNIILKNRTNAVLSESFESINIGGNSPVVYNPKTICYSYDEINSVYLYTDGVIDQRGGEDNKKFGTKRLKELIENLNTNGSEETLLKIESELNKWAGTNNQMDDITLLGLQINA